jgi:hypothetical protein
MDNTLIKAVARDSIFIGITSAANHLHSAPVRIGVLRLSKLRPAGLSAGHLLVTGEPRDRPKQAPRFSFCIASHDHTRPTVRPTAWLRNPTEGGQGFRRKADSNPMIADSG